MRLFFALWPSQSVRAHFHDWARAVHADCGGRVLRAETLHLTLAFLGEVDPSRLDLLMALMQRTPLVPCTLTFDHLVYEVDRKILWASANHVPDALGATRDTLLSQWQNQGGRIEVRSFRPHVTLLRHARCAPADPNPKPVIWTCDNYVLIHSVRTPRGPHYRRLASTITSSSATDITKHRNAAAHLHQYGIVR